MITPELEITSPDDKLLIQVSPQVIEGILGEESPENLPKYEQGYTNEKVTCSCNKKT